MQTPLEIRFHNIASSPTLEAAVCEHFRKIERFAPELISCRVTIDSPHQHREQGRLFAVTIDLRFAGGEVVASRHPGARHAHEDAQLAVRDAFAAARRQLEDRLNGRRDRRAI